MYLSWYSYTDEPERIGKSVDRKISKVSTNPYQTTQLEDYIMYLYSVTNNQVKRIAVNLTPFSELSLHPKRKKIAKFEKVAK